jgi:hypothetical protein
MLDVVLLGPQFRTPVLRDVFARVGVEAPFCAITAGWQEREGELQDLEDHLGQDVTELRLYERAEAAFARDTDLHNAYRERQNQLREQQELYRLRLEHAKAAWRELGLREGSTELLKRARRSALAALRRLDREHLAQIDRIHREFETRWRPGSRPPLAQEIEAVRAALDRCRSVLIAGGHVAVLLNRLGLFGMRHMLEDKCLVGWSAGAMVLTEQVVLFHDNPPQGRGSAEVFERGLGLVPNLVALPHAESRLALDRPERLGLFARRFAPSACVTLDEGAWLQVANGRILDGAYSSRVTRNGRLLAASATA